MDLRLFRCFHHFLTGCLQIPIVQIVCNRFMEQYRVLWDDRNGFLDRIPLQIQHISISKTDRPMIGIVESVQKTKECRFATTRRSNDGNCFPFRNGQCSPRQDGSLRRRRSGVRKLHIVKHNRRSHGIGLVRKSGRFVYEMWLCVFELEHGFHINEGLSYFPIHGPNEKQWDTELKEQSIHQDQITDSGSPLNNLLSRQSHNSSQSNGKNSGLPKVEQTQRFLCFNSSTLVPMQTGFVPVPFVFGIVEILDGFVVEE